MMQLSSRTHDWLTWMLVTSIPLRHLDERGILLGIASGCLVIYKDRKFLLTVCHAVHPESKGWAIELGDGPRQDTSMYWLNTFLYMTERQKETGAMEYLDFCFAEVAADVQSIYAHRTPHSVSDVRPRHIFGVVNFAEPTPRGVYAFSGQTKPEMHDSNTVATEMDVYPGLTFVRSEGPNHIFQLPVDHPGHDSFRGCSGSPIIDMDRRVIALVTGGDKESGTITGVAISRARVALDWYCNTLHAV
jgi:hypothetical protein